MLHSVGTGNPQIRNEPMPSDERPAERRAMRMLTGNGWMAGFCPYFRHHDQVRIRVRAWITLSDITDAFIQPGRRIGQILAYVRMYGLWPTITKIISRLAESDRNSKCIALGWGIVTEAGPTHPPAAGQPVVFLAPFHPQCVDEVCLHHGLMRPLDQPPIALHAEGAVFHGSREAGQDEDVDRLAGWMEWSGTPLDEALVSRLLDAYEPLLFDKEFAAGLTKLPVDDVPLAVPVRKSGEDENPPRRKRAVLFGLGQYAKVGVIPRVSRYMDVVCLHELDPAQLGLVAKHRSDVRTSMHLEPDERYDVLLIASYHHTHAPLAVAGLKQGAAVVLEKPLVTTREQLDELLAATRAGGGNVFCGYQRRYGPLNAYLVEDLLIRPENPVSMRAIVYEVQPPRRHWYRWPNSGSRIISNGCHWIDHFLFLNNFVSPTNIDAHRQANGDVLVTMDLENGASLCLIITEWGTPRLGMRDIVHFTAGDRAATITDCTRYVAESSTHVLRRARAKRIVYFDDMYETISRKIATDQPGDSLTSIEISTRAVLDAEAAFQRAIAE